MTHDEIIAVVQAHKEGKTIQAKTKGGEFEWADIFANRPLWNFSSVDYRVKSEPPKPREFWICCNGITEDGFLLNPVIFPRAPICNRNVIHVREVPDASSVSSGTERG